VSAEASRSFACFGAGCAVLVGGDGDWGSAADAVVRAERFLHDWHDRFTRFAPGSELSRLNADPRPVVPASEEMAALAAASRWAADHSGGLVDATLLGSLESAGYSSDLRTSLPLALALRLAPPRRPAGPDPAQRWRALAVEPGAVRRSPGLRLDSGGIAKGLAADRLAASLGTHASFGVDCSGDLRLGGTEGRTRSIHVESPFGGERLHTFELSEGGVATSGIGRRSWLDARGRPAHHLLDPSSGRPAFTGVVQVTALAPTALEAEVRAKAALLSGPADAATWLPDGGVVVRDDGSHEIVPAPSQSVHSRLPGTAPSMDRDPITIQEEAK
jgi:thiamine biosynthesis lipoprotein